jgi:hypothetical protein
VVSDSGGSDRDRIRAVPFNVFYDLKWSDSVNRKGGFSPSRTRCAYSLFLHQPSNCLMKIYCFETFDILNLVRTIERRAMSNRNATSPAPGHTHYRAICDEIGERLRDILKPDLSGIPPRLLVLLDKLAELEHAPSIVPCINEMCLPLGPNQSAVVRRSTDLAGPATNRRLTFADS